MSLPKPELNLARLPAHDPGRFEKFIPLDKGQLNGFKTLDGTLFEYQPNGGWVDEWGCVYDENGNPNGWLIIKDDQQHYYNEEGYFVPESVDPQILPKHKEKLIVDVDKTDRFGCFLDNNGCYYNGDGIPIGWKLQKAENHNFLFNLEGQYVDESFIVGRDKNDLQEYDLEFIDYKEEMNSIQQATPRPQFNKVIIPKPGSQGPREKQAKLPEQQGQRHPNAQLAQKNPPNNQFKQQAKHKQNNQPPTKEKQVQKYHYNFKLIECDSQTPSFFWNYVKENVKTEKKMSNSSNKDLFTVITEEPIPFLDKDLLIFGDNKRAQRLM